VFLETYIATVEIAVDQDDGLIMLDSCGREMLNVHSGDDPVLSARPFSWHRKG
jgi:hypothetical protein